MPLRGFPGPSTPSPADCGFHSGEAAGILPNRWKASMITMITTSTIITNFYWLSPTNLLLQIIADITNTDFYSISTSHSLAFCVTITIIEVTWVRHRQRLRSQDPSYKPQVSAILASGSDL